MKLMLYAVSAQAIAAAAACAAYLRAGGHKARAVDATLLTAQDREEADFIVCHEETAEKVRAVYLGKVVFAVDSFDVEDFSPSRMESIQRFLQQEPEVGSDRGIPNITNPETRDSQSIGEDGAGASTKQEPERGEAEAQSVTGETDRVATAIQGDADPAPATAAAKKKS